MSFIGRRSVGHPAEAGMVEEDKTCDFAVIGAGIAGASVAAELVAYGSVMLLEMESQPGYHTTGRSAALFSESYGPAPIRALSRASAHFFDHPPEGFSSHRLLTPRGVAMIARDDQLDALDALIEELSDARDIVRLDAAQTRERIPLLREGYAAGAMYDERSRDIDVHALHQGFLRAFRAGGGKIETRLEVTGLARDGAGWTIETTNGVFRSAVVVNAAGAWADQIGALARAAPIGLVPKRRTAMTIAAPDGVHADSWPMAVDVEEAFYLKPESGRFLISPADETPSQPCDAQPDEMDVAICIDHIEKAFDMHVRRIENKWAGLRSFVADKSPVCGYDGAKQGFFWLAGQGGYGIQTSPALARLAANLVTGRAVDSFILDEGLDPASLSPERLSTR
jgi:D-arginine dehydrogenase